MCKIMNSIFRILIIGGSIITILVLSISGCATKPAPKTDEVVSKALPGSTEIPERWAAAAAGEAVEAGWLESFNDPVLSDLVNEAMQNNLSLRAAVANLDIAAGLATQAGALLIPAIDVSGGASQTGRGSDGATGIGGVALNLSWELDLWGRMRATTEAAQAVYEAVEAEISFARQSLAAQTAKSWYLVTETHLQAELAREAVDIYTKLLKIVEVRRKVGRVSKQDVHLILADLATAKEKLEQVRSAREQAARSLEVILGRYPSGKVQAAADFVPVPPEIPGGLPAELLERRPDIISAERQVAAAFKKVEVAKLARLPRVAITGSGGRSSGELIDLIGVNKNFWSVGANLLVPLDVGGGLKAQVKIETAKQEIALAQYGQTALRAFSEVETGLVNERFLTMRERHLAKSVAENAEAYRLANVQYKVGRIDLLSVLQMQVRVLTARTGLIRIRNAQLANRIDLYLALGGGFEQ